MAKVPRVGKPVQLAMFPEDHLHATLTPGLEAAIKRREEKQSSMCKHTKQVHLAKKKKKCPVFDVIVPTGHSTDH